MSTSLAYHTQGIVEFQHHSFQYSEGDGKMTKSSFPFTTPTDSEVATGNPSRSCP